MPTTSLTYSNGDGTRISTAIGRRDGLKDGNGAPRAATMSEAKDHLSRYLTVLVIEEEVAKAREEIATQPSIVVT